ncbi:MAG: response regulator [Myxococcales bacterium]|nr:response regulator [Myxococcales bacterium]
MSDEWEGELTITQPGDVVGEKTGEVAIENRARLVDLTHGYSGSAFVLGAETVTLGRLPEATISLDGSSISREHARIVNESLGHWVLEDVGSRNGTYLNNVPVKRATLSYGDIIRLGNDAVFVFTRHDSFEQQLLEAQKLESVGRLAGGVAHDFNNMLGVVLANAQYMLARAQRGEPIEPEEIRACLDDQLEAANHATKLTRQLLHFARLGEGDQVLTDVSELVETVLSLCRRSFGPQITVERNKPDEPLVVNVDPSQLSAALMNLLVNAGDALAGGSGSIHVDVRALSHGSSTARQLPLLPFGRYVEIAVADTGSGMDDATRSRIFEPFFTTKEGSGTGLGLASAYGVVRRHGGDIRVESELGEGTTFRVYLPRHDAPPPQQGRRINPTPSSGEWSLLEGAILVIDDERSVRTSISRLLALAGHSNVLLAADGLEGIEMYRANRAGIGLVLLDMKMPGLDGAATFERLVEIDPDVVVLLISGNLDDAPSKLRRAVRQTLPKPFTLSELRTAINACRRADRKTSSRRS